jgi:hypothetical protein
MFYGIIFNETSDQKTSYELLLGWPIPIISIISFRCGLHIWFHLCLRIIVQLALEVVFFTSRA